MDAQRAWSAEVEWSFPPTTASIASARNAVSDQLGRRTGTTTVEDIRLLVSELVTNAVVHVGSTCTVTLRTSDTVIRVEVGDGCRQIPVRRHPAPGEASGRGLLIIETVADRWGVEVGEAGKTVWFEMDTPPARS